MLILFADSDTAVLDLQLHSYLARLGGRLQVDDNPDLTALGKLDGVADQVGQHLLETQRVQQDVDRWVGRVELQPQFESFLVGQPIEVTCY